MVPLIIYHQMPCSITYVSPLSVYIPPTTSSCKWFLTKNHFKCFYNYNYTCMPISPCYNNCGLSLFPLPHVLTLANGLHQRQVLFRNEEIIVHATEVVGTLQEESVMDGHFSGRPGIHYRAYV